MNDELQLLRLTLSQSPEYDIDTVGLSGSDLMACDELHCVINLSASCSLDMHPGGSNWVQKNGGLPTYICEIAKSILESGKMSVSHAIATAVSRVKVWAAGGGGVSTKTQAKASAAVAQWEKLKAKANK